MCCIFSIHNRSSNKPKNYKKFKSFQSDLRNNFVITSLQEGEFHSPYPNITVYIDKVFKDGQLK